MFAAPGLSTRQWINGFFWQPFPIYTSIVHRLLAKHCVTDTTGKDRLHNPTADMPYLRIAYRTTAAVSALVYLYVNLTRPSSPSLKNLFSGISDPLGTVTSITQGMTKAMKYDQIAIFGASTYWILLHFGDLKRAGKLDAPWWKVIGAYAGSVLVGGPGAALAVMWGWREEVMANRSRVASEKSR
jgi:hypothetical protein